MPEQGIGFLEQGSFSNEQARLVYRRPADYCQPMGTFKRNQIDDAIIALFDARENPHRGFELRRRITRLLQTDRRGGAPFAFFSDGDLGSGSEAKFSSYEAFGVLLALVLLEQGFPQATAVAILRSVRRQLSEHYGRIMATPPSVLFDSHEVAKLAQPGALAVGNTDPTFLAIARRSGSTQPPDLPGASVCRGFEQLNVFARSQASVTIMELVNLAHDLDARLREVLPKSRGRPKKLIDGRQQPKK